MDYPDKKIIAFIKKHHVLTLATARDNFPYCCTCFYVYNEKKNTFIITSEHKTRHASEMIDNKNISAAIALETSMVGKIQGVQIFGTVKELKDGESKQAKIQYILKFPVAALTELFLWELTPEFIKLTDNRLGFGKKLIWEKPKP